MACKQDEQHAGCEADSGQGQQDSHADVIEQRAADGDRQGKAEKGYAQDAGDHGSRVDLIDRIEEDALEVGCGVGSQ